MIPAIRFEALPAPQAIAPPWRKVVGLGWLDELALLPIASREILNLAHHAPLVVSIGAGEPHVQALVRRDLLKQPLVDRAGQWKPAYRPLALRALPLLLLDPAAETPRATVIAGFPEKDLGPPLPWRDAAGRPRREAAAAEALIAQLAPGARELGHAAERLLAAGLLMKLRFVDAIAAFFGPMDLFATDAAKLAALSPLQTAALAREGSLALDLLIAGHFSMRLLNTAMLREAGPQPAAGSMLSVAQDLPEARFDLPELGLDASELFSIDGFRAAAGGEPAREGARDAAV